MSALASSGRSERVGIHERRCRCRSGDGHRRRHRKRPSGSIPLVLLVAPLGLVALLLLLLLLLLEHLTVARAPVMVVAHRDLGIRAKGVI